jgi:hypothetical protein
MSVIGHRPKTGAKIMIIEWKTKLKDFFFHYDSQEAANLTKRKVMNIKDRFCELDIIQCKSNDIPLIYKLAFLSFFVHLGCPLNSLQIRGVCRKHGI